MLLSCYAIAQEGVWDVGTNKLKTLRFHSFVLSAAVLSLCSGRGAPALAIDPSSKIAPSFCKSDLVQSVPLETSLEVDGLPKTEDVWFELVSSAKTSIDLSAFYISSENRQPSESLMAEGTLKYPMERVIAELEKAANRGVHIRVLVSNALLKEDPKTLARLAAMKNSEVRSYDMAKLTHGVQHAKYWVVDKKRVFVGSHNMDWRSLRQNHELGVCVEDTEVAKQLTRLFELDWRLTKNPQVPSFGSNHVVFPSRSVELLSSPPSITPPEVRVAIESLVELLEKAQKTISIQMMEYSTSASGEYWSEIDKVLRNKALHGVKIQILIPQAGLEGTAGDALRSLAMQSNVELKVISLPPWSKGEVPFGRLVRSKYLIVDGQALWIGNSNLTHGYFYNSRNVELILNRPEMAKKAETVFQKMWNSSYTRAADLTKKGN